MAVTATAAIAASMSISAFADPITPATGEITVTSTKTPTAAQYTVMLFKGEATATSVEAEDIYYINQGDNLTALVTGMKVKATTTEAGTTYLPVGTYTVRIGNSTGSVENITLVVEQEAVTPTTFKITGYVADAYATVTIGTTTVNVDAEGAFSFADLANGAYDIIVKAPGALNRTLAANVNGADVAVSTAEDKITLVYGAVREDATEIAFEDLSALLNAYRAIKDTDATYTLSADFDRNGAIEFDDLSVLLNSYRMTIEEAYAE